MGTETPASSPALPPCSHLHKIDPQGDLLLSCVLQDAEPFLSLLSCCSRGKRLGPVKPMRLHQTDWVQISLPQRREGFPTSLIPRGKNGLPASPPLPPHGVCLRPESRKTKPTAPWTGPGGKFSLSFQPPCTSQLLFLQLTLQPSSVYLSVGRRIAGHTQPHARGAFRPWPL